MEKHELKKYKNILKQGLSIREASRILKIVLTKIYRRFGARIKIFSFCMSLSKDCLYFM